MLLRPRRTDRGHAIVRARARKIGDELGDARLRAGRAMEAEPYHYKGLWEAAGSRFCSISKKKAWRRGYGARAIG